jgi:hypothetical protein
MTINKEAMKSGINIPVSFLLNRPRRDINIKYFLLLRQLCGASLERRKSQTKKTNNKYTVSSQKGNHNERCVTADKYVTVFHNLPFPTYC